MRHLPAIATLAAVALVVTLAAWSGADAIGRTGSIARSGSTAGIGSIARVAGKPKPGPTHLLVYAQEWSLWPSRGRLPAGTVDVELWNRGQDMHDLRIRHVNASGEMVGPIEGAVRVTASGGISDATWHLKRGRYMLYCAMPGHLQMGMHARITVN